MPAVLPLCTLLATLPRPGSVVPPNLPAMSIAPSQHWRHIHEPSNGTEDGGPPFAVAAQPTLWLMPGDGAYPLDALLDADLAGTPVPLPSGRSEAGCSVNGALCGAPNGAPSLLTIALTSQLRPTSHYRLLVPNLCGLRLRAKDRFDTVDFFTSAAPVALPAERAAAAVPWGVFGTSPDESPLGSIRAPPPRPPPLDSRIWVFDVGPGAARGAAEVSFDLVPSDAAAPWAACCMLLVQLVDGGAFQTTYAAPFGVRYGAAAAHCRVPLKGRLAHHGDHTTNFAADPLLALEPGVHSLSMSGWLPLASGQWRGLTASPVRIDLVCGTQPGERSGLGSSGRPEPEGTGRVSAWLLPVAFVAGLAVALLASRWRARSGRRPRRAGGSAT